MAVVTCPACGREIPDYAAICPGCGQPAASDVAAWNEQDSNAGDQGNLPWESRKEILAQELASRLVSPRQWRVESWTDHCAIVVRGEPVNHVRYLTLTFFILGVVAFCSITMAYTEFLTYPALGLWFLVWMLRGIAGGETRYKITVDEYGKIANQKLDSLLFTEHDAT